MANRLAEHLVVALRPVALVLCVIVVTSASVGWMYWLESKVSNWPGPRLSDVVPLDELSLHDGVPLIVYLLGFGLLAVLLGVVCRLLRLRRRTASIALFFGVGVYLYGGDAVSLFFVRQIGALHAMGAAAAVPTVYLSAAIAGLSGLLLARPQRRSLVASSGRRAR